MKRSLGALVLARAKLNLTLDIMGKRPDGYHELESVVQSVDLHDRIGLVSTPPSFEQGGSLAVDVRLSCGDSMVPAGPENLACRAATALASFAGVRASLQIAMEKGIPAAAGLGGGSADAAAVLGGLNWMWRLGLSARELAGIGERLGADVPFCVTGGSGIIRGKGEQVEPLPALEGLWFVVVVPPGRISSAEAYARFDRLREALEPDRRTRAARATTSMIEAVRVRHIPRIASGFANDLEEVAASIVPSIAGAKQSLLSAGALGVGMSGSGPAVFGLARSEEAARSIEREVCKAYRTMFVCCSIAKGIERIDAPNGMPQCPSRLAEGGSVHG